MHVIYLSDYGKPNGHNNPPNKGVEDKCLSGKNNLGGGGYCTTLSEADSRAQKVRMMKFKGV